MLFTGLSVNRVITQAKCSNCEMTWMIDSGQNAM